MTCLLDDDNLLPSITENATEEKMHETIRIFKATLTPDQRRQFNVIDDMLVRLVTKTQHDTIRAVHCPSCRHKKASCR